MIQDVHPRSGFFCILEPGVKSTEFRIPNTACDNRGLFCLQSRKPLVKNKKTVEKRAPSGVLSVLWRSHSQRSQGLRRLDTVLKNCGQATSYQGNKLHTGTRGISWTQGTVCKQKGTSTTTRWTTVSTIRSIM